MDAKRSIADKLLDWYDRHARTLPWRAPPGVRADPYRVWLSEVMLQQTTVATVRPRFEAWVSRWPDVASLAAADEAEVMAAWAGLGYYARARNLVRAARAIVADHGGHLPDTEAALRALPGLGDYTAAAVAAIAFGQRAVVIDANVERVVSRLFRAAGKPAVRAAAEQITPDQRAGDFAQAMMDLGSAICSPRKPKCLLCPLADDCAAHRAGEEEAFPVKPAKKARPARFGTIFWLEREVPVESQAGATDREVLLVRRPSSGLLGGMRALPTGPWEATAPGLAEAPAGADWTLLNHVVGHGFTHFTLELALAVARCDAHSALAEGEWWPVDDLASAGLPTVFAKAAKAIGRMR
ncbi:A/G-specific adenine glycosylase [Sphingomonas mucosissima]|uniref:Adenine DNA glycosylase n=1 Tax=Sphingomonas mucosissima TaxID=370959 RepID=A0A245ZIN4_9SPHN|nr:A/G-specific adenine glycosylase [Sphingomonas mucosissima]